MQLAEEELTIGAHQMSEDEADSDAEGTKKNTKRFLQQNYKLDIVLFVDFQFRIFVV